ncbi:accessory gene regulator B [Pilibacter termitis]|uniref:Accessory gene regulator B n=1 Tax=Pilibacter termitis TaxID=263852 RepID=A0A1T4KFI9_9ENTE|nr:accessory gene regulator AgrB [Pilibacter termitis]SJZ41184.1 accessory gene regulator B [Pilibacter termitis]
MIHQLSMEILEKLQIKKQVTEREYLYVAYFVESWLLDLSKTLLVYGVAFFVGCVSETFFMHLAYVIVRRSAGGWHAATSIHCSLFSISCFVGIPFLIKMFQLSLIKGFYFPVSLVIFVITFLYAPADTEKNPLLDVADRKKKRVASVVKVCVLLLITSQLPATIQLLTFAGLLVECLMIAPFIYNLTKEGYRNYERYE